MRRPRPGNVLLHLPSGDVEFSEAIYLALKLVWLAAGIGGGIAALFWIAVR